MSNIQSFIESGTLIGSVPYPKLNEEVLTNRRHPENNKPIYTKVFDVPVGTGDVSYSTGLTGVDRAYVAHFELEPVGNNSIRTEAANGFASELRVWVSTDGATITYRESDTFYDNSDLQVTLEYTKTADTVNSPIAVTQVSIPQTGVVGFEQVQTSAVITSTSVIPNDDTLPTASEGTSVLTIVYTPKSANSLLQIKGLVNASETSISNNVVCSTLIVNGTCVCSARRADGDSTTNFQGQLSTLSTHQVTSLSPITINVRVGSNTTSPVYVNSTNTGLAKYGGSYKSTLEVMEINV